MIWSKTQATLGVQARVWHQGHLGLKPEAGRDQITKSFMMRVGV